MLSDFCSTVLSLPLLRIRTLAKFGMERDIIVLRASNIIYFINYRYVVLFMPFFSFVSFRIAATTATRASTKKKNHSDMHCNNRHKIPSIVLIRLAISSHRPNLGSSVIRKSVALKRFSALVSTEQHHATIRTENSLVPYAHLRKGLDYTTYHTNYRKNDNGFKIQLLKTC